jgi:hypothetical protein
MRLLGLQDQDSVSDVRRNATAASISPMHSLETSPRVHPTSTHKELFDKDTDMSLCTSPDPLLRYTVKETNFQENKYYAIDLL